MLTEKVRNERPEAAGDTDMASTDTVTLIKQNHGHQAKQCNAGASVYRREKGRFILFGKSLKVKHRNVKTKFNNYSESE